jgi:hypothetical protein
LITEQMRVVGHASCQIYLTLWKIHQSVAGPLGGVGVRSKNGVKKIREREERVG